MPSNQTTNYQLSQWVKSDQVKMEDFNADNAKVDGALHGLAQTVSNHGAAIAKLGNCQICTVTYVGTGTYGADGPTTLTFPRPPVMVVVTEGSYSSMMILVRGVERAEHTDGKYDCRVAWNGRTVSMQATTSYNQMNNQNLTYTAVALMAMDE